MDFISLTSCSLVDNMLVMYMYKILVVKHLGKDPLEISIWIRDDNIKMYRRFRGREMNWTDTRSCPVMDCGIGSIESSTSINRVGW